MKDNNKSDYFFSFTTPSNVKEENEKINEKLREKSYSFCTPWQIK